MKENDEYVDEDHKKKYDKSIFIFFSDFNMYINIKQ